MDISLKVVTQLPLTELWRTDATGTFTRMAAMRESEIRRLLRDSPVHFVVAETGKVLDWITVKDCFDDWKEEVKPHLATPAARVLLSEFPGGYCYFASRWGGGDESTPIIVLEKHH